MPSMATYYQATRPDDHHRSVAGMLSLSLSCYSHFVLSVELYSVWVISQTPQTQHFFFFFAVLLQARFTHSNTFSVWVSSLLNMARWVSQGLSLNPLHPPVGVWGLPAGSPNPRLRPETGPPKRRSVTQILCTVKGQVNQIIKKVNAVDEFAFYSTKTHTL